VFALRKHVPFYVLPNYLLKTIASTSYSLPMIGYTTIRGEEKTPL
jgi:hypothetical protein